MNCSECNQPHSIEQPLTVTGDKVMLCPDCLDIHKAASAAVDAGADPLHVLSQMYGVQFIDMTRLAADKASWKTKVTTGKVSIDGGKTWLDMKDVEIK